MALTNTHLVLIAGGSQSGSAGNELRIPITDLDGAGLYLGDVTHSNQLQLKYNKSMLIVHVSGTQRTNNDIRTQQLYDLLISEGVPRMMSEQIYYVGMDLSNRRDSSPGKSNLFGAAAGARLGGFIWDSIKTAGKFVVSPFSLL